jgi:hypothetical protein
MSVISFLIPTGIKRNLFTNDLVLKSADENNLSDPAAD